MRLHHSASHFTLILCILNTLVSVPSIPANAQAPKNSQSPATPKVAISSTAAPTNQATLSIDVTDTVGNGLACRVQALHLESGTRETLEVATGVQDWALPPGNYRTYVEVYERGVPVLVDARDVTLTLGANAFLPVNLIEWGGQTLGLRDFDFDGDLAIDRVELAAGTDPKDGSSIPGRGLLEYPAPVLGNEARWYKGELFARSNLGLGSESVGKLISRAEKENMDFLAIADRNHLNSTLDPDYKSSKVVLIPAMEWGNDERGYALMYAPRTVPDPPGTVSMAQAECIRVQAQGGVVAIAHPCLSSSPWKWGLSYMNAVQVWYGGWNELPPLSLAMLPEELRKRDERRLVYSIAAAAAASDFDTIGGNAQASMFWDYELVRGLMAGAIAGTGTASAKVPMGAPITYIYAREKSLAGLLEGLRLGRTYVSSSAEGPQLLFRADIAGDGKVEIGMGGIVPVNVESGFEVGVRDAQGKKLQVLLNGYPLFTKVIESDSFVHKFKYLPKEEGAFRVRVISPNELPKEQFGRVEVHAMSSPIYAQDVTREAVQYFGLDPDKAWISAPQQTGPDNEADLPNPEDAQTQPIDFRNSFGRYQQMNDQPGSGSASAPQQQQQPEQASPAKETKPAKEEKSAKPKKRGKND